MSMFNMDVDADMDMDMGMDRETETYTENWTGEPWHDSQNRVEHDSKDRKAEDMAARTG